MKVCKKCKQEKEKGKRYITCWRCKKIKPYHANGFCHVCYSINWNNSHKSSREKSYAKANPGRELRRNLRGVKSLWNLTKGKCVWEGCRSGFPKVYAQDLCKNCYNWLIKTPNFPQVKELYNLI